MTRKGPFPSIPLGEKICTKCTLDSPNLARHVVSCSVGQMWEAFYCFDCKVKGLVNVSISFRHIQIYTWDDKNPIAQMAMTFPPKGQFG